MQLLSFRGNNNVIQRMVFGYLAISVFSSFRVKQRKAAQTRYESHVSAYIKVAKMLFGDAMVKWRAVEMGKNAIMRWVLRMEGWVVRSLREIDDGWGAKRGWIGWLKDRLVSEGKWGLATLPQI